MHRNHRSDVKGSRHYIGNQCTNTLRYIQLKQIEGDESIRLNKALLNDDDYISVREWTKLRTFGRTLAEVSRVAYIFNNIVPDNLSIMIMLQSWTSRGNRMRGTGILVDSANQFRRRASIPNFLIPSPKSAPPFGKIFFAMTLDPSSKPTSSVLWGKEIRVI